MRLFLHPFSSFCQKALIAFYERDVPFEPVMVGNGDPEAKAALEAVWPLGKFPVLHDEAAGVSIPEASIIVEYIDRFGDAPKLVPSGEAALPVRLWDRVFDLYVELPLQKIVGDRFRPDEEHDGFGIGEAEALLRRTYSYIEGERAKSETEWIAGSDFTLADCAAAPALFYAGMLVPFDEHPRLAAYYRRLRSRPSFARAIDEARPYRSFFPLPWREGWD